MLALIHDPYYRDAPDNLTLSGYVAIEEACSLRCGVFFKAGHAPEQSGDRSRPPQELWVTLRGTEFTEWLAEEGTGEMPETLQLVVEKAVAVTTTSKRWRNPAVGEAVVRRESVELTIISGTSWKKVLTLHLPLGVLYAMRRAHSHVRSAKSAGRRRAGIVITWPVPAYRDSLIADANWAD